MRAICRVWPTPAWPKTRGTVRAERAVAAPASLMKSRRSVRCCFVTFRFLDEGSGLQVSLPRRLGFVCRTVPIKVHFLDGGNFLGASEPKAHPRGIGEVPNTLGKL